MTLATFQVCLLQSRRCFLLTSRKLKNMMSKPFLVLHRNISRVLPFLHSKKTYCILVFAHQIKRPHFLPTNFHSTSIFCFVFISILHLRKELKKSSRFTNKEQPQLQQYICNYRDRKTSKITKTLLL